ncbi:hypothetical protein HZS_5402 [Henneguya salminicola]|nr:hypothetical protein HZS_5402 [Henneguya salminicola]
MFEKNGIKPKNNKNKNIIVCKERRENICAIGVCGIFAAGRKNDSFYFRFYVSIIKMLNMFKLNLKIHIPIQKIFTFKI